MSLTLPTAGTSSNVLLEGPVSTIEALLSTPKSTPRGGCVICHPHPLYGGAMSNKVVYTLASTAAKAGLVTLRFNFRGVGKSVGPHDEARGETDDTVWLAGQLRASLPASLPIVLAGFSFGAFVALKAATRVSTAGLMSVAPPFSDTRDIYNVDGEPPPRPGCPWVAIHSRDDDTVAYDDTAKVLAAYRPPPMLITVDGAGHFFHGHLGDVAAAFTILIEQVFSPR